MPATKRNVIRAEAKLSDASGASKGVFVVTRAGDEYLVKAKSLCDMVGPYIPANELVAVELADWLDLPVLAWDYVQLPDGDIGFGSRRMQNAEFGNLNNRMAALLYDPSYLSAIAVFDLWIANTDRHSKNLLCRKRRGGTYQVLAHDHSHALVREHLDPTKLAEFAANAPREHFFHSDELRAAVRRCARLEATLEMISTVHEDVVRAVVNDVPESWMGAAVKELVIVFLLERSRRIRTLFATVEDLFPNLVGGAP